MPGPGELKQRGVIRHIGLSSHNPEVALAAVLAAAGICALEAFIRELGRPSYIDGFTDTLYNEY